MWSFKVAVRSRRFRLLSGKKLYGLVWSPGGRNAGSTRCWLRLLLRSVKVQWKLFVEGSLKWEKTLFLWDLVGFIGDVTLHWVLMTTLWRWNWLFVVGVLVLWHVHLFFFIHNELCYVPVVMKDPKSHLQAQKTEKAKEAFWFSYMLSHA